MSSFDRNAELHLSTLAASLASLRQRAGLSQAEVARRMNTTQTAIARLERGQQSPTTKTLRRYAQATGFCLEIGFIQSVNAARKTGCIFVIDGPST